MRRERPGFDSEDQVGKVRAAGGKRKKCKRVRQAFPRKRNESPVMLECFCERDYVSLASLQRSSAGRSQSVDN